MLELVFHIIPGQGYKFYERPEHVVLTNFSPFKWESELHPWMGLDRYQIAESMLANASDNFGVNDMFEILKACSQEVCPTVVSMVFDTTDKKVYWCENRQWDNIQTHFFNWNKIAASTQAATGTEQTGTKNSKPGRKRGQDTETI